MSWVKIDDKAWSQTSERGIVPELAREDHTVCTVGRSSKNGKWYGWSHRALAGFRKGSTVREGDVLEAVLPVAFEATGEDDKRDMAVKFAGEVG